MTVPRSAHGRIVLAAFLLSGGAALVYEVTWTRALALVLGSTTHALSTMLATFMTGLALGALVGGRLADRFRNLLLLFGLCELGIGLTGLLSVPLIYALPGLYLAVYRAYHLYPLVFFVLQIAMCALVMIIPTTLMGATFPLVSRALTGKLEEMGEKVGKAYGFNTIGAVIGSLVAGFLLIPWLGIRGAALTAALLNLVIGLGMVALGRWAGIGWVAAVTVLYLPAGAWTLAASEESQLVNFYTAHRHLEGGASYARIVGAEKRSFERLFDRHYRQGAVRAFRSATDGSLVLQVGGKIESGARDRDQALLVAYLPLAAHPRPRSMLVIGLGAGVTLAAAREHVERVDLVEIHPGVVEVASRWGPPDLLAGVRIARNDARNHLLRTDERYDVITSVPSLPTEAVVANLFTREFYQLAGERLRPGGIYCQWLPYYLLTDDDVTMMLKTFAAVFHQASLWKVRTGRDLILLGSHRPLVAEDGIRRRVGELNTSGRPLAYVLSRTPEQIAEIAARAEVPLNTDDHPILEFRAAGNLLRGDPSLRAW